MDEIRLARVKQEVASDEIQDLDATVRAEMETLQLADQIQPGASIAVALGSRGISGYAQVVKQVVETLRDLGAIPFVVPAMGSHGGGTAEGQRTVLKDGGMGPDGLGVPLRSSLDVTCIGESEDGMPIYWDRHAAAADGVVVVNRIKAHTAFRAPVESGLCKILSIGLGKKKGAETIHAHGIASAMPIAARFVLDHMPILAGVGIIENGRHRPARIVALPGPQIYAKEPELLREAKVLQPSLPFAHLDLLIIDEIGKDISGTGMDTSVVGIWRRNGGPREPDYACIVALNLTDASHGNASGVGMADIITRRLYEKIDLDATYTNCRTANNWAGAKIPMILASNEEAIQTGLGGKPAHEARIVHIRNTLELDEFRVSPALFAEVEALPTLVRLSEPEPLFPIPA